MSWHYQIRRRETEHGPIYGIVEVYGKPFGETVEEMTPISDTRRGLITVLEMMLNDAKRYKTLRWKP